MTDNKINNILVIRLAGLGDMLLTLSAISPLKKIYPGANIYFLTDKFNLDFLKCFSFVTDTFEYKRGLKNTLETIKLFRDLKVDTIINFERAIKKTLISYLIKSPVRIGYNIFPNKIFNTKSYLDLKDNPSVHMRERYFKLTGGLGLKNYDIQLDFIPTQEAFTNVQKFLKDNNLNPSKDMIVGINPVTGFKAKYWFNDRWAEVADYLIEKKNAKVVFTYGPSEDQLNTCKDIINRMKHKPILSFKTNLIEFGALLKNLDLLICLDSGPFHFAMSLNIPTISLWGRGNLKQWGPEGDFHIGITKNVPCSPCNKFDCEEPMCMSAITTDDVIQNIEKIYQRLRINKNNG